MYTRDSHNAILLFMSFTILLAPHVNIMHSVVIKAARRRQAPDLLNTGSERNETMEKALVNEIAADTLSKIRNVHGHTVESLVNNWERRIEWLGLKVGGKAWQRELLKVARAGWIASTQKTSVFIPPSEETLSWGGFLGGEFVTTEAMTLSAESAFDQRFQIKAAA